MKFSELNISPELVEAVGYMGFENCTPIQEQAIPSILDGKDLIGCAQTGTGKTAAFLIPILEKLANSKHNKIKCLVLVPTRELCLQIDEQVQAIGYFMGISCIPVFGGGEGGDFSQQKNAIQQGADIIIATPGRLIAHMNLGYVDFSGLEVLIMDEADRMLDMGFIDDINKIIKTCPTKRQTLMFSATMATQIRVLAKQVLTDPLQINLAIAKPAEGVNQQIYLVHDSKKIELLLRILEKEDIQNMIIFASRKEMVDQIERQLQRKNHSAKSLHSGREQAERQERLREFKAGNLQILVATDVLSRGIDIDGLSHVLNFDMPNDAADYVHRVGRTARADKKGTAISFVNQADQLKLMNVEELIEKPLEKLNTPEDIGESPAYDPESLLKQKGRSSGKDRKGGKSNFKGKRPEGSGPHTNKGGGKKPWFKKKSKGGSNSGNKQSA
ncbi:MAG: DEAD/DEAH box helicase [Flavobacteriales bacterium]|nr:DEAD/DEAH box helicase [Flavobacteriales bacterium]